MLVITGTQRSGTTLIAQALHESGYDLGTSWFDEEAQGGFDSEIICGFYRKYLGDPTFPFDDFDVPETEPGQFKAMDYEVVKYSYLLMSPVFVSIWHKFRPKGDKFLVMCRSAEHVVASKLRRWERFRHDSLLLVLDSISLWGNFEISIHLLHDRLGYQYEALPFPKCTSDLGKINEALGKLDPNVQIKSEVWERLYDPSKIHFK